MNRTMIMQAVASSLAYYGAAYNFVVKVGDRKQVYRRVT